MILLIYNQKMCREILLPNLRDSDYAISISGKAYGLRQDIRLLLEITGVTWKRFKCDWSSDVCSSDLNEEKSWS